MQSTVTNGNAVLTVHKNQSTYIPIGAKHRLEIWAPNHCISLRFRLGNTWVKMIFSDMKTTTADNQTKRNG